MARVSTVSTNFEKSLSRAKLLASEARAAHQAGNLARAEELRTEMDAIYQALEDAYIHGRGYATQPAGAADYGR